jgi:hypothetical protein
MAAMTRPTASPTPKMLGTLWPMVLEYETSTPSIGVPVK